MAWTFFETFQFTVFQVIVLKSPISSISSFWEFPFKFEKMIQPNSFKKILRSYPIFAALPLPFKNKLVTTIVSNVTSLYIYIPLNQPNKNIYVKVNTFQSVCYQSLSLSKSLDVDYFLCSIFGQTIFGLLLDHFSYHNFFHGSIIFPTFDHFLMKLSYVM